MWQLSSTLRHLPSYFPHRHHHLTVPPPVCAATMCHSHASKCEVTISLGFQFAFTKCHQVVFHVLSGPLHSFGQMQFLGPFCVKF